MLGEYRGHYNDDVMYIYIYVCTREVYVNCRISQLDRESAGTAEDEALDDILFIYHGIGSLLMYEMRSDHLLGIYSHHLHS